MTDISEQIDRLIHDAQHADSGFHFASMMGHRVPANELREKRNRLKAEATALYLANPDAEWPDAEDCEWPAPKR